MSQSTTAANDIALPDGSAIHVTIVRKDADPTWLSQDNCLTRGLTPAKFLRALRSSGLPVTKVGDLRLVEAAAFDAWLRSKAERRAEREAPVAETSSDELLRRAGLRRARG